MELNLKNRLYLVVDVAIDKQKLLDTLQIALKNGVVAVQVWTQRVDHLDYGLLRRIIALCRNYSTAVLINNHWQLLDELGFNGVHFDAIPADWQNIRNALGSCLYGITCNNDLSIVKWAEEEKLGYISFCSVFPSHTSNSCELVDLDRLRFIRELTTLPLFLAGGITPENVHLLHGIPFDGIALISGILAAEEPDKAMEAYKRELSINEKLNP